MQEMPALKRPELVVALDVASRREALDLAVLLRPVTPWMKVGLELFTAVGPAVVAELQGAGCRVFLDLKFHDIPNTVAGAVRGALKSGAEICNVHVSGGEAMCRAAAESLKSARGAGLLLGVTVLTSTAPGEVEGDLSALVLERAVKAKAWGLGGVVCSVWEAAAIKAACGESFICLCPGIRPAESSLDDQSRVATPAEAARQGADYIVVGRPITRAADPKAAAVAILNACV